MEKKHWLVQRFIEEAITHIDIHEPESRTQEVVANNNARIGIDTVYFTFPQPEVLKEKFGPNKEHLVDIGVEAGMSNFGGFVTTDRLAVHLNTGRFSDRDLKYASRHEVAHICSDLVAYGKLKLLLKNKKERIDIGYFQKRWKNCDEHTLWDEITAEVFSGGYAPKDTEVKLYRNMRQLMKERMAYLKRENNSSRGDISALPF